MESDVAAAFLFICQRNLISLIALGGCNFDVGLFVSTAGTIMVFVDVCALSHLSKNLLKQGKPPRNIFSIREEENVAAAGCRTSLVVVLSFCSAEENDDVAGGGGGVGGCKAFLFVRPCFCLFVILSFCLYKQLWRMLLQEEEEEEEEEDAKLPFLSVRAARYN